MDEKELNAKYCTPATAATDLKLAASRIYDLLRTGKLVGIVVDGKWLVTRASVARLSRERARQHETVNAA